MKMSISKTETVSILVTLASLVGLPKGQANESIEHIEVYKTPTCRCCVDWINHIGERNFETVFFYPDNLNALKN